MRRLKKSLHNACRKLCSSSFTIDRLHHYEFIVIPLVLGEACYEPQWQLRKVRGCNNSGSSNEWKARFCKDDQVLSPAKLTVTNCLRTITISLWYSAIQKVYDIFLLNVTLTSDSCFQYSFHFRSRRSTGTTFSILLLPFPSFYLQLYCIIMIGVSEHVSVTFVSASVSNPTCIGRHLLFTLLQMITGINYINVCTQTSCK